jgi:hypothetical protein
MDARTVAAVSRIGAHVRSLFAGTTRIESEALIRVVQETLITDREPHRYNQAPHVYCS